MPTAAQCSQCQRTYVVIGPHSPILGTVWICPRCKRGRNLPREATHGPHPLLSSPTRMATPR